MLQTLFSKPKNLLNAASLTFKQKKFLLIKWQNEREEYLTDNYRHLNDKEDGEMARLVEALRELRNKPMSYN
jgi:hypothetical protein